MHSDSEFVQFERQVAQHMASNFAVPRQPESVISCLVQELPGGSYLIYGAGSHSRLLLKALRNREDIEVLGIIDRRAPALDWFEGLAVFTQAEAARLGADRLIVAHPLREGEMLAALDTSVWAPESILTVYSNPELASQLVAEVREQMETHLQSLGPRRHVILATSDSCWQVVPDRVLNLAMPAEDTVRLYFGLPQNFSHSEIYTTLDLSLCETLLRLVLDRIVPETVYVQTSIQWSNQYLSAYVRHFCPQSTIIHEIYDWGTFFSDELLREGWGFDRHTIALNQFSERYVLGRGLAVICKNGGAIWDDFVSEASERVARFFPNVDASSSAGKAFAARQGDDGALLDQGTPLKKQKPLRFVFAGTLPPPSDFQGSATIAEFDLMPYFEKITTEVTAEIHIFNNGHQDEALDGVYQEYLERYAHGPVRYHRRVPLEELQEVLGQFDAGWLFLNHEAPETIADNASISIPNKFTGYLSAGLPVVVISSCEYIGQLVSKYEAGCVIDPGRMDQLIEIISRNDWSRYRRGAQRLLEMMQKENEQVLDRLQGWIGRGTIAASK